MIESMNNIFTCGSCNCSCCDDDCGCGCDCGCDRDCDCDKHDHDHGHDHGKRKRVDSYLKFSAAIRAGLAPETFELGDCGPLFIIQGLAVPYSMARDGRLKDLAVNLTPSTGVPPGGLVAVQLFKNNAPVPDFLLTWGPGELLSAKLAKTDVLKISRGDILQLRLNTVGLSADSESQLEFVATATIGVL